MVLTANSELAEEVERLKAKNEELEDANVQGYEQLKRLAEEIDRLTHLNMSSTCAYCGEFFEADADATGRKLDALQEHMQKCEKHPMTALRSRAEAAGGKVAEFKQLFMWRDGEPYYKTANSIPQEIPKHIKSKIKQILRGEP